MAQTDAILERLLKLHPKIIDLDLGRMHTILEKLDNPQNRLPKVVHIAGTNGKGSTLSFIKAILEAAGKTVSAYTSPHLVHFNERINLAGIGPIKDEMLQALLTECEEVNAGEPITYFEITTAAALLAFSRHPSDFLLLETGLGGRLDATNVVKKPVLTVITRIDLDHQQYLGETITEIAREKAGIIKPDVPCIISPQHDEVRTALEDVAMAKNAPLQIGGQDWQVFEQHGRLVFENNKELLDLPLPGLSGRHQFDNAGTAIAAVRSLNLPDVTANHIADGLKTATWPARMQRLEAGRIYELAPSLSEIWLDGGHNPAAGAALAMTLAEINETAPRPLVLIIGMLNTKDPLGYFEAFESLAQAVITVQIKGEENALSAEVLASVARQAGLDARPAPNLEKALLLVGEFAEAPRVLIGGSLYLAGEVLAQNDTSA